MTMFNPFAWLHWREKLEAFWTEFSLLVIAVACIVAAIALLSIRVAPALLEKWTGLDALKRTAAYVLLGVALFLGGQFIGYRKARDLSQESALRAEIAARDAVIAEKDRQAQAARTIADAASARADAAQKQSEDLQSEIDAYADELAKRPADSRCVLDDRDVRGLQSIGRAAANPPKPPSRPFDLRPSRRRP